MVTIVVTFSASIISPSDYFFLVVGIIKIEFLSKFDESNFSWFLISIL